MRKSATSMGSLWLLLAAMLCGVSTWIYADRVMVAYQVAEAAAHDRPRGNLSDLYPRWLGARELLRNGRDPYSLEVEREIQIGYYGRVLDRSRSSDPRDEQGFAYPVYVVFLLAPTIGVPFPIVQKGFFWLLVLLTAAGVLIWLRVLKRPASYTTIVAAVILTLGSLPVMQGLKLQQMSLLIAALLVIAIMLFRENYPIAAGIVLAVATVKPQLMLLLLIWLGIWTTADMPRRYRWAASFVVTMGILFGASEVLLPHWFPRFLQATREYQRYADAVGILEQLFGVFWGRTLEILAFSAMLRICWKSRREPANSASFAFTSALVLAVTALLVPKTALYNQVLLVPAILVLVEKRNSIWRRSAASRLLFAVTAALILWPWIASTVLMVLSYIRPAETATHGAVIPFWTSLLIPMGVAAVMLLYAGQRTFSASAEAPTS